MKFVMVWFFCVGLGLLIMSIPCEYTAMYRQANAWKIYNLCLREHAGVSMNEWMICHNKGVKFEKGLQ